jgi:hypothetical protein
MTIIYHSFTLVNVVEFKIWIFIHIQPFLFFSTGDWIQGFACIRKVPYHLSKPLLFCFVIFVFEIGSHWLRSGWPQTLNPPSSKKKKKKNPPSSTSWIARITSMNHHVHLAIIFYEGKVLGVWLVINSKMDQHIFNLGSIKSIIYCLCILICMLYRSKKV